ncbi:MAG: hypothetical protein AAF664_14245 [Planctomycetota bacterium]
MKAENPYKSPETTSPRHQSVHWSLSIQMALLGAFTGGGFAFFGPTPEGGGGLATSAQSSYEVWHVVYGAIFGLVMGCFLGFANACFMERWPNALYRPIPDKQLIHTAKVFAALVLGVSGWHLYRSNWFGFFCTCIMATGMPLLALAAKRVGEATSRRA